MNRGNYYKRKTKEWMEKEGYVCEYLEKLQRIYTTEKAKDKKGKEIKKGKIIYIKRDLFGADLLCLGKGDIIFIQVKSGKKDTGINIKKAYEEFNKYPFPEYVKRWIVVWRERAREPEIIEVKGGEE